jgi:hypothetical protein
MVSDLVSEQVEINPGFTAAAFGQPQDSSIEFTGLCDVTNSKSEMKRANRHAKPLSFYGIYLLHLCGPNLHKLTFS